MTTAVKVFLRFIGTCWDLSPFLPLPFPLSFFASWGFPECNSQVHPSLSLVCPWTLVRSWEHLPFSFFSPLPFSPSLFLSFLLSLLPPSLGVPGCFCHGWEPSPLSLWCVLGRMRRSWEHLPFSSLLFLVSPYPSLLAPFSHFPSPFLSLLPGVFLNATVRFTPLFLWCVPGRLFVAGNTCLFLFSLLSLSLPLSFFLSFSLSFLPPWVSLDAFVMAGNLLLSSFGVSLDACVVAGNTFLSLLFLVSPYPSLLSAP